MTRIRHGVARSTYPLQTKGVVVGALAAAGLGAALWSPVAGFSVFVLFTVLGLLWRADEPPALAYCLAFQWTSVSSGLLYQGVTGSVPGDPIIGDLDYAVLLSLVGLLVIAIGMRLGLWVVPSRWSSVTTAAPDAPGAYSARRLFWVIIGCYSLGWMMEISPAHISFEAAQFIHRLLEFRSIFLFLLLLSVFQARKGYAYAAVATFFVWIPMFASVMSLFTSIMAFVVVALLREWRPWSRENTDRGRAARITAVCTALAVALWGMAMIWQAGVKPVWRPAVVGGEISGSPVEKIGEFASVVLQSVPGLEFGPALEALVGRVSSDVGFFSNVVVRVPDVVPHEGGELTWRAIEHVLQPRFLFPDKPNLGSDSWLIWKYAGLRVAGLDDYTASIGLGYMGEFYIDFGSINMFAPMLFLGILMGLIHQVMHRLAPSRLLGEAAAAVLVMNGFSTYGAEIAKMLGGLLWSVVVTAAILYFCGGWLDVKLKARRRRAHFPAIWRLAVDPWGSER
jgi:hypothetical protein